MYGGCISSIPVGIEDNPCILYSSQLPWATTACLYVAEAEEEAFELRKRSLDLERLAQQLRAAFRSQPVHQAPQTAHANQHASQQQELVKQEGKAQQQQQHQQQLLKQESDDQRHQAQVELETDNQQHHQQQQQGASMQQDMRQEAAEHQPQMLNQDSDAQLLHLQHQQQLQSEDHQQQQLLKQQTVLQISPPGLQEPLHGVEVHQEALSEIVHEKGRMKDTDQQNLSAEEQKKVQGLVVWGLTKGWPAWPALVITEEEIEVADVQGSRKNLQKGAGNTVVPTAHPYTHVAAIDNTCGRSLTLTEVQKTGIKQVLRVVRS